MDTWRDYLDDLYRHLSPRAKRSLLAAIGIDRATMQRWRSGEHLPRKADHLRRLLDALPPQQSEPLRELLFKDPLTASLLAPSAPTAARSMLPADLYRTVLLLQRSMPNPFWMASQTILSRLLALLARSEGQTEKTRGTDESTAIELVVTCCLIPLEPSTPVRSLYEALVVGTHAFHTDLYERGFFHGAESLAMQALLKGHGLHNNECVAQSSGSEGLHSLAAFPLARRSRFAGTLLAKSEQAGFFSTTRLLLLEQAADLLAVLFEDSQFTDTILPGRFPDTSRQLELLATFPDRVELAFVQESSKTSSRTELRFIERQVRLELEQELLLLSTSHPTHTGGSVY